MRIKLALVAFAGLVVLVGGAVAYDIYQDRAHSVLVIKETALLAKPYPLNYGETSNRVVASLYPGARPKVLRITYGKDYMAIRVRTDSNAEGWVIYGPSIEVSRP